MVRFVCDVTVAEIAPPFPLEQMQSVNVLPHTSDVFSLLNSNTDPFPELRVMLLKMQFVMTTKVEQLVFVVLISGEFGKSNDEKFEC